MTVEGKLEALTQVKLEKPAVLALLDRGRRLGSAVDRGGRNRVGRRVGTMRSVVRRRGVVAAGAPAAGGRAEGAEGATTAAAAASSAVILESTLGGALDALVLGDAAVGSRAGGG